MPIVTDNMKGPSSPIAVIGMGTIGVAFTVLFAKAGFAVQVFDPAEERRNKVIEEVSQRLQQLDSVNLLTEDLSQIESRVVVLSTLDAATKDAQLIQECVPEQMQIKHDIFVRLSTLAPADCIIASSTSFIPTSKSASGTGIEERTLVAHPGNPPYAIPVIELVPNHDTHADTVTRAQRLYADAGMSPIVVKREIEGFVFNRLQGAVLREAYSLVRDGIASVEDIDTVMRDGLGRRWSFMGPFETVDLNTRGGIVAHAEKMGPFYHRMGLERGDTSSWDAELVRSVASQRRALLPLDEWESRVEWRDRQLLHRATKNPSC